MVTTRSKSRDFEATGKRSSFCLRPCARRADLMGVLLPRRCTHFTRVTSTKYKYALLVKADLMGVLLPRRCVKASSRIRQGGVLRPPHAYAYAPIGQLASVKAFDGRAAAKEVYSLYSLYSRY
jgi:hypothetical protein